MMNQMTVTIKLSPLLRRYFPNYDHDKGILLAGASGKKVSQIIRETGIPEEKITSVLVNHMPVRTEYAVKDGDFIMLAMLIGGG